MKKKEEIDRIKTLLGFHYFVHERIYRQSNQGYVKEEQAIRVLRQHHNIPKDECPIILKGLEILGLISKDGKYYSIVKPKKSREELVFEYKKKLKLI